MVILSGKETAFRRFLLDLITNMSIEQPRFKLTTILIDIEGFERDDLPFLFSPEFISSLNRSDVSALLVLKVIAEREPNTEPLRSIIRRLSAEIESRERSEEPVEHEKRVDHQRTLLQFQLARKRACEELRKRELDLVESTETQAVGG